MKSAIPGCELPLEFSLHGESPRGEIGLFMCEPAPKHDESVDIRQT